MVGAAVRRIRDQHSHRSEIQPGIAPAENGAPGVKASIWSSATS